MSEFFPVSFCFRCCAFLCLMPDSDEAPTKWWVSSFALLLSHTFKPIQYLPSIPN